MASKTHKMLVDLIGRKMIDLGYLPVAFDGKYFILEDCKYPLPPVICRHRPDVVGINTRTRALCIGEAKTESDLSSERTREQLSDYLHVVAASSEQPAEIIIGIVHGAEAKLILLLRTLGVEDFSRISIIVFPKELA